MDSSGNDGGSMGGGSMNGGRPGRDGGPASGLSALFTGGGSGNGMRKLRATFGTETHVSRSHFVLH